VSAKPEVIRENYDTIRKQSTSVDFRAKLRPGLDCTNLT